MTQVYGQIIQRFASKVSSEGLAREDTTGECRSPNEHDSTSTKIQMDKLCAQYAGFYRFAKLLEDLARGIQDGTIDVPK